MRAFTIAAMLAAASPVASADNALRPERIPNKARELAAKGRKHHTVGDYSAAVAAFKEAYVLAPSPGLLFNIAQAYRLGGNCDEAAWMYRRFLDTDPKGTHRELAQNHLSAVEKCGSGGLRITVTPPALQASVPEPTLTPSASLTAMPSDERRFNYKRVGLYTGVGGGVVLLGAALFALDASNAAHQVEETYARGGKWKDVKDIDARGKRSSTYAAVLGIGGGIAVLSGAVMYGLGRHYEPANRVAITPRKQGAQVSMSWGF